MSMSLSSQTSAVRSDINITPMVDVVLVLIIIFMVVTPMMQMGYDIKVPPKAEDAGVTTALTATTDQIVIRLDIENRMYINKEQIPEKEFAFRLQQALQGQDESKVVFFSADGELPYEQVVGFLDHCKDLGATNLGIVLEEPSAEAAASGDATTSAPAPSGA